ncbi:tumor necrosis factor receptor superfamily member 5-like [Heterodontus francisci]|uniref:tumor necrosis factor receptor superfamily member 5-like n=1 Tax=Heterodontus francisci TaxID=7792 RepID=UPI00355B1EBF
MLSCGNSTLLQKQEVAFDLGEVTPGEQPKPVLKLTQKQNAVFTEERDMTDVENENDLPGPHLQVSVSHRHRRAGFNPKVKLTQRCFKRRKQPAYPSVLRFSCAVCFSVMELISALLLLGVSGACSAAVGRAESPRCSKCRPGTFVQDGCTTASNSICAPCPAGSYTEHWNNMFSCFRCIDCNDEGMKYKKNCTMTSDAQCECREGYVCDDEDCRSCILKGLKSTNNSGNNIPWVSATEGEVAIRKPGSTGSTKQISHSEASLNTHSPASVLDEVVEHIPCSLGTYSDTGTEPCRPWTNCTALDYFEIKPASQTSDTICKARKATDRVKAAIIAVAFISFFLLCLSFGMHLVIWRKNRRKEVKLLPAEMSPRQLNGSMEDACSTHFPEQECGGLSHEERKTIDQTYVAISCSY